MRCHKCAFVVGLLLTHSGLCRGQDLQPGEIKLLGGIASIDSARKTFVLTVERFVVPSNREGTLKEKKNKTITVDEKTVICLVDNREQKLSIADLKVGMSVAAIGKDLGEGSPLPAREVLVWQEQRKAGQTETKTPTGKLKTGIEVVDEAMRAGALDKALTELTRLLTAEWQNQQAWRWTVRVLGKAKLASRTDLANRFKSELLTAAGENLQKGNQVLAALVRGGFAEVALPEYDALLTKDALEPATWTGKALAQLEQYQIDAAQDSASHAIKVNGNYAPGYVMKGKVQVFAWQGEAAMQTLRDALQKGPDNADAHGLLAQACLQQNDEASADAETQRALALDADNPEGLFALGMLQERRGQKREAQKTWDKYLDVDPVSERAERVRAEVVVTGLRPITNDGRFYQFASWSPDGQRVVAILGGWCGPIVIAEADGSGKVLQITDDNTYGFSPYFSKDGRRVVYIVVDDPGDRGTIRQSRLMIKDAIPEGKAYQLISELPSIRAVAWHPAEDKIILSARQGGGNSFRTYTALPDGSNLTTLPFPPQASYLLPTGWSHSGDSAAFLEVTNWKEAENHLVVMCTREPFAPVTLVQNVKGPDPNCSFSHDDTKILFSSSRVPNNTTDIWVCKARANARPILVLYLDQQWDFWPVPAWSPTKNEFMFCRHRPKQGLWVATLGGKRTVMDLADVRVAAGVNNVIEGGNADTQLTVTLRNLTPQPLKANLEVELPGNPGAVKGSPATLTVPARGEMKHTIMIHPGKRGSHQVIVKAKGEEFDLEKTLTVRIIESWDEKKRVVVLPLFNLWAYEPDKHWAGAAVWKLVMEKLSRLWQIRSPNMIGQTDYPSLTGQQGMYFGRSYIVQDGKQVLRISVGPNAIPLDRLDEAALDKIARALPFPQFVVWGSVQLQEASNKVAVELKLIDLKAKKVVEGKEIKGEWEQNQLPEIAGELARRICEAVGVKLEPEQSAWLAKIPTRSLDAMRGFGKAAVPMMTWDHEEARKDLLESLAQDPQFAEAHKTLGYSYLWQGKSNEALGEFRIASSLDPDDVGTLFGLAQAYAYVGTKEQRMAAVDRILQLDPYHPHALHIWAGERLQPEGRIEEAAMAYEKSLLDPYRSEEWRQNARAALARIYEQEPKLDPTLKAPLTAEYKDTPLQQIVKDLSQSAKVTIAITAPNLAETKVTLPPVKTVGEAMAEILKKVQGRWQRTEAGYFLVAREN